MRTFAVRNGDLVLTGGGYNMVTGQEKLRQDLYFALAEALGSDRFHDGWGSLLPSYIGQPIGPRMAGLIEGEVRRVIANYSAAQQFNLRQAALGGMKQIYQREEIVADVVDVRIDSNFDALYVLTTLRTVDQAQFDILTSVTTGT